jgi:hypothetical protein
MEEYFRPDRPFLLSVDSGSREEPPNRYFETLKAAVMAMQAYPEHFQRFAWIVETDKRTTHIKDGRPLTSESRVLTIPEPTL